MDLLQRDRVCTGHRALIRTLLKVSLSGQLVASRGMTEHLRATPGRSLPGDAHDAHVHSTKEDHRDVVAVVLTEPHSASHGAGRACGDANWVATTRWDRELCDRP